MRELEHILAKTRQAAAGGFNVLSHGEQVAVALILNRPDWLVAMNYTMAEAIDRVGSEWLALIPKASRQIADEAVDTAERAEIKRAEAMLERPGRTTEPEFLTSLVNHAYAPGYRDVSFIFEMTPMGSTLTRRAQIHIRPEDAEPIVDHLRHAHRLAWSDPSGPIDRELNERRPTWVDA